MKRIMRKIIICIFLSLLIVLLNCCITNKIIYDKSIPAEQLCTLEVPNTLTVTSFDGDKVKWEKGFWDKTTIVKIPAGEHELTVDYLSQTHKGDMIYISSAKNLKVKYDFKLEANHKLHRSMVINRITVGVEEIYR
jgi:hypothetical protein